MKVTIIILCSLAIATQAVGQYEKEMVPVVRENTVKHLETTQPHSTTGIALSGIGFILLASCVVLMNIKDPYIYPTQYDCYDDYILAMNTIHKKHKSRTLIAQRIFVAGIVSVIAGLIFIL